MVSGAIAVGGIVKVIVGGDCVAMSHSPFHFDIP